MTISISGIGWINTEGFGRLKSSKEYKYRSGENIQQLPKHEIFSHPFKNFGRMDTISRVTACAAALALKDAGVEASQENKTDTAIIGTSSEGSLRSDLDYFQDYVQGGRTLSRANLFIYTLPSSPLGEAAIHLGCTGPLLFVSEQKSVFPKMIDMAEEMLLYGEADAVLVGRAEQDAGMYMVLKKSDRAGETFCTLEETRSILSTEADVNFLIHKFTLLRNRKVGS